MVEDLIYDIGLHRGEDTAFYLAKGFRVVAVEADPSLAELCRVRFADAIVDGRLRIVEGAISSAAASTVTFYRHSGKSDWGTLREDWAERNLALEGEGTIEAVDVATVELPALLEQTGVPYFMKIDIEGADDLCLRALRDIDDRPAYVSIESSKSDFAELRHELDLLVELGYSRFAAVQQERIPASTVETVRRDGSAMRYTFEPNSSGAFGVDIGPWHDRAAIEARYRRIFRSFRAFGDTSPLRRVPVLRRGLNATAKVLPFPLPGWYDLHAAR
jgi:FkbM family methyltransferase